MTEIPFRQPPPPGYEAMEHHLPPMDGPAYFDAVEAALAAERALAPWSLVRLPNDALYVAVRRTWWWRLKTAWFNFGRRKEAKRMRQAMAFYFSDAQVMARKAGR